MTTYNAASVTDSVIAYQKPITLQQGRALRDNPKAVAEADATAPASLLPTVLLGTITTTSGTTQTLSSLVLAPYKSLRIVVNNVSFTTLAALALDGKTISATMTGTNTAVICGIIQLDLVTGIAAGVTQINPNSAGVTASLVALTSYTNASTSIVFSGGTFDAGSILVYGEK